MLGDVSTYCGKLVDDLTREEAIEAVKVLGRQLSDTYDACRKMRELDRMRHDLRTKNR
jgi:hypothetical protein